jgi:hypothetical protein
MYSMLLVKNTDLVQEYLNIMLLKLCLIGNFIVFFQFLPPNNLFYTVHISIVQNILSNA